ncbi:unnamed protein product [Pieris brassicae]|uniref:Secreted protein n=1 Tax=Pieris brassicae TaxID=7116 RepID=A0A9P0XCZ9_PIEBR|nr:unnamed protein product [Pieris brassicae]CAH4030391.1 unnamed protein product [Pieris brassicae]
MVSSKIIILAIVLFTCIMHSQAAPSDDGDKDTDGGFSLSNLEAIKNFNKIFSEISKNPTQTFSILTNSIRGKAKGSPKNKGSDDN